MGDALTYVSVGLKVVTTRVGRLRKEDIGYWVERESRIKESLPLKRESFFFFLIILLMWKIVGVAKLMWHTLRRSIKSQRLWFYSIYR